jgi:O-antigen ligase
LDHSSIGRGLFLAGIFLMVTGDWPQSVILPNRGGVVPLQCLAWAWPWVYLVLLATSLVFLMSSGVLRVTRATTSDFLLLPLVILTATFLLSVVFSQVPALSWWAFGCFLAIVGFTLAVARIGEDETFVAGLSIVLAAAAVFLAVRVIAWRFDEGLTLRGFHIRNNAWLGKNQISWVLNLLAPLLLARFLAERAMAATLFYGGAWFLVGAAVYLVFSSTGVAVFVLTTLSLCALNAHYWRRWLILLTGFMGLALGLIAVSTKPSTELFAALIHPGQDASGLVRQVIWRQTVQMIVDHPITGIGLGTYDDVAYSQYHIMSLLVTRGNEGNAWYAQFFRSGWHAHNTHLHLLAETGAVGFLAWCYLWFTIVRFLLRRWRDGDMPGRLNSSAVLCLLLAFFVHSMTDVLVAARVHASLRMNLTLALLVIYGIRLAARTRSAPTTQ